MYVYQSNVVSNDLHIAKNSDLAIQHPEILQKMMQAYDKFAKDVRVVVPSTGAEAFQTIGESID